jgi:hypothetical protein
MLELVFAYIFLDMVSSAMVLAVWWLVAAWVVWGELVLFIRSGEVLFFSKWEQERPSLCIKMMHTALFIKAVSKVFKVLLQHHHGSIKVAANISQRKKKQAIKSLCDISNTPRLQPTTLVEYSPNDRHQAIASSNQRFPLFHRKEV